MIILKILVILLILIIYFTIQSLDIYKIDISQITSKLKEINNIIYNIPNDLNNIPTINFNKFKIKYNKFALNLPKFNLLKYVKPIDCSINFDVLNINYKNKCPSNMKRSAICSCKTIGPITKTNTSKNMISKCPPGFWSLGVGCTGCKSGWHKGSGIRSALCLQHYIDNNAKCFKWCPKKILGICAPGFVSCPKNRTRTHSLWFSKVKYECPNGYSKWLGITCSPTCPNGYIRTSPFTCTAKTITNCKKYGPI